jgi:2-hydroxymuconate-semialdehyde hydrolase
MDAKTIEIEGHAVHYLEAGSGFPVLMFHGVGPGTSAMGTFGPALEPLAERYRVIAVDLIGFGESARKAAPPFFDVDLWLRQGLAMIDALVPDGPVGLAGHSLGGALVLKMAARNARVAAVLASSAIGAKFPVNDALNAFWDWPVDRAALRAALTKMAFDQSALTDEMIDGRWAVLNQPGYADYFAELFGGDRQQYLDAAIITPEEAARIEARVTLIHGRDDNPCPAAQTALVTAGLLPAADLLLLGQCGHNLPRERPADYLSAAFALFG